jgi:hypothetical protein
VLSAADVRASRGDALALFRILGYAIEPVEIDANEWRRAGIALRWNGECDFRLASRVRRFDLFHLRGEVPEEALREFLRTYRAYNVLTKSVVVQERGDACSIYDLSARRELRRLDVDLSAPTPHALSRLNLLAAGEAVSLPKIFDLALDRETLTCRFFERFRDAVREVAEAIASCCPAEPRDACDAEALLILSRLLFLSFVQEKGWLNGEPRFLFDRMRENDVFTNLLRPLFFGCLNTPVADRDAAARRLGRIPYLNGGLFEPSPFEWRNASLTIDDALLRRVIEDVFERFDFSSDERDAAGTHVDPEMLGKVFESLMNSDERAASGSFYTPREIVDVLTTRAVDEWLGDGTARDKLARIESISVLDPACGSGAFLLSALGAIERRTRELAREAGVDVAPNLRQQIVERSLFGVDVKPEAVRLCELRLWLAIVSTTDCAIESIPPLPNLDRNIMQGNSLLGPTDFLGDSRGEIYRQWMYALRAQGDLVDRYRRAKRDERPALARLIRENDRRLASDLVARAIDADEAELQRLAAPQRDLFGRALVADLERSRELQIRIIENHRMLDHLEEGTLDFFSFDVHFAPVMANGGFDVVAGNPPWVRNGRIDARAKRMVSDRYSTFRGSGGRSGFHQPDLSVAFFERALALTNAGGVVSMLMPAKILNAAYAAPLRRTAMERDVVSIDDWSASAKRHFDADTFPLGLTVRARRARLGRRVQVSDGDLSFAVDQRELVAGSEWALVPRDVAEVLGRLRREHRPLAETLARKPLMGVKTGDNAAFFIGECRVRRASLLTHDGVAIPLTHVARCVRGRDLQRWRGGASEWMLWPPRGGWKTRPQWLLDFAKARGVDADALSLAFVKPEHVGIKVAWKDVSRGMAAAVLPDSVTIAERAIPLVPNQTLYSIDAASLDEAYAICAMLNSTIADALVLAVAERAKDAHFRLFGRTVAAMPLPHVGEEDPRRTALIRLARRAHATGRADGAEVDRVVAAIYGVSDEELAALRRFVDHRLAR